MKRSEHEAIIREHLSALAWANDGKTREFVGHLAGLFGIFDAPLSQFAAASEAKARAQFLAEHKAFHRNKRPARPLREPGNTGTNGL